MLAAVDRAVAGTAIEPIAVQRVLTEERLKASQEATNLTNEEKFKAAEHFNKEITEIDNKLASFEGTSAYNLFKSILEKHGA